MFDFIINLINNNYEILKHITTPLRWIFVVLAIYILVKAILSLLSTRATPEVWGYMYVEGGYNLPISHWENLIGRSSSSDLKIDNKSVSRNHAIMMRRKDGSWIIKDLSSKNGTVVNGTRLEQGKKYLINTGDEIVFGNVKCNLAAISFEESRNNEELRRMDREPMSPWKSLIAVTIFQILSILQLMIGMRNNFNQSSALSIIGISLLMWAYVIFFKKKGRKAFEMEIIAFFMSTISLLVTASASPTETFKQFIAICIGVFLLIVLCYFQRDLERTKTIRLTLIVLSIGLLLFNLIFGTAKFGATNWVSIGGMSLQPSELVKVAFILIGAGTLEELFRKNNLYQYMAFSAFCLLCLAIMRDFGTALIFFSTYLVVSYLRSGDFSRLILTGGAAGFFGLIVLRFMPYIADRFGAWRHVWEPEFVNGMGYQQTRTMSYGAGGGLLGLGGGNGGLKNIPAANTDLVFGYVMEEWGYIIAILLVLCIITLSLFAVNSIVAGRSTFYTIASCGAATMFMVQTMLNVFGSVDLFPLTGVTFPFISTGGTSMLASWAMLSYFKVSDMRKNASIAVTEEVEEYA